MSVANLYDAIISLKQAADTISDIGGRSERDQADLMRCIAKDAMSEYHEISKVWSDFQAFKRIKSDAYDQYVTRDREPKYDSCSCHLSAPCSYCTRDADEETKGHVLPAPLTKHCSTNEALRQLPKQGEGGSLDWDDTYWHVRAQDIAGHWLDPEEVAVAYQAAAEAMKPFRSFTDDARAMRDILCTIVHSGCAIPHEWRREALGALARVSTHRKSQNMQVNREEERGWRFDVPDADNRRGRHIVAITGQQFHSGQIWHRLYVGVAATMYKGRQGYVPEDIARLEERGGMDPDTAIVVAWMDFVTPPLTMDTRDLPPLPMPERDRTKEPSRG